MRTLRSQPTTRVLLVHRGRLALGGPGAADGVALLDPAELRDVDPATDDDQGRWLFLGEGDGTAYLALVLPDDADAEEVDIEGVDASEPFAVLARERTWSGLRDLVGEVGGARRGGSRRRRSRSRRGTRTTPGARAAAVGRPSRRAAGRAAAWPRASSCTRARTRRSS